NGSFGFGGDGGPATSARFFDPLNLAFGPSGDLYIADTLNNAIRKVDHATGILTTIAGMPAAGYSGDGGPATAAQLSSPQDAAVDASRNVYIADMNNGVVRRIDGASGIITTFAGSQTAVAAPAEGLLATNVQIGPTAVAVNSHGIVYIFDG